MNDGEDWDDRDMAADDEQLLKLEAQWRTKFERVTVPEPSRQDTFRLIEVIKEIGRLESQREAERQEQAQEQSQAQSQERVVNAASEASELAEGFFLRIVSLLRSQWNFYGIRSWLLTCIAVGATGYMAYNGYSEWNTSGGLHLWIFGLTLVIIGGIAAAFRPRDEGTMILQQLGKYSLLEQILTRFLLVTCFQLVIALPLSLLLYKEAFGMPLAAFLYGWIVPVLTVAVCAFVLNQWLGMWPSAVFLLTVWSLSLAGSEDIDWLQGLADMSSPYFMKIRAVMLATAACLLIVYALRQRQWGAKQ